MGQHNLRDSKGRQYKLPGDEREMDRLALQHRMWRLLVDGLCPSELASKVDALLAARSSAPAVLDVGCGSGIWAIEMAETYPHVRVIGMDIAPIINLPFPPNFQFTQMDLTVGLPEIDGGYDIVHARCVTGHLQEPAALVRLAYDVLKPGGLLILGEAYKSTGADKTELPPLLPQEHYPEDVLKAGSWYAGWQKMYFEICYDNYQTVESLIREHGGFSLIHHKRYFAPVNWSGDGLDHGEELGRISNTNTLAFCRAVAPAFLKSAEFSATELEEWIDSIEQEFQTKHIYMPWDLASGVKLI
ncbi:S-adenosyl-L-methionine-dependent methyltransferase [Mycena sp. CBHHK59/15]|nr:S-adenosyl-L-methionine-dependent methyltransferase [Mycena sp. CBHHK59/15]